MSFGRMSRSRFNQTMTGARIQIEAVKPLQFLDAFQALSPEWALPVERVQHDPFEQISERQVVVFGKGLEHFQQALFHANARLYALDRVSPGARHRCLRYP